MKWTKGSVTLAYSNGKKPVVAAYIFGNWAVHKASSQWKVSHVPSGLVAGRRLFHRLRDGKTYAERLNAIWDGQGEPSGLSEDQWKAIRELARKCQ